MPDESYAPPQPHPDRIATPAASPAAVTPPASVTSPASVMPPAPSAAPVSSGAPVSPVAPTAGSPWRARLLVAGLVLAALNLRPAITSLGALLEEVRTGLHMSGTVAGVLTSVPPLCFAVFGLAAPRLARRAGPEAVVLAGMAAIAVGVAVRPFTGGTAGFLAVSALALMGIAVGNVLMPVIVKRHFPDRVGPMTGLYSMALAVGTASAAALTVPLTRALGGGWRTGLAMWAVLGVAAVLPWPALLRDRRGPSAAPDHAGGGARAARGGGRDGARTGEGARDGARTEAPGPRLRHSRTAWALACFFGLQATGAYITMGWIPQLFRDAGVPAGTAGVLLAVIMVMGVPMSFVIPRLGTRMRNQGPIVVVLGVCGLIAYAGVAVAPAQGAWLWAVLLGISGCTFPLALTMIGLRSRSGAGVVRLSAFAQSVGYLISIPGPVLVGVLYQHSGGWGLPVALMAGLLVPQMVAGVVAGRDRTIEDEVRMGD
ncbi:CynX/NimT family MFS transporter [Streptomyces sp. NPDC093085]|uniref:CynX/NimT family MFS transporter n=1 Tax=Streptomyces sp. NPDC093085 TaxID=3155068 RepID=UPI003416E7A7